MHSTKHLRDGDLDGRADSNEGQIDSTCFRTIQIMGSGIRKNSEVGGKSCQTCGLQMSYDICYEPPTFIFKLDEALVSYAKLDCL
jgi:hypothetical protein